MSKQPYSFWSSFSLLWRSLLIPLLALVLLPSFPLSAQSFQDDKVYQVTGAQLNKLSLDLQTAKKALQDLQIQNDQLKKESDDRLLTLKLLQAQLQTASLSLKKYEETTVVNIVASSASFFLIGSMVGWGWGSSD